MRTDIANPYGSKREREREYTLSASNSVAIAICDGKNIRVRYE